jgi:hypothetical protein
LLFGIFCGHFGIFFPFRYFVPRKIWQPWIPCLATCYVILFVNCSLWL